jgi:Xaa-Pro aminopeptidase
MLNRVDKLRELLNDDEAALISSYPNIFYYSGFTSEDAYLLISHERQLLVTDSRYTIQAHEQAPDFEVVDIKIGFEEIFRKVKETHIGYEEAHMTVAEYKKLWKKLGSQKDFIELQKVINQSRRIKDLREIEKIAEAEKIGDAAFEYVLPRIKVGRTEREIALELEFFMKNQGATALSFDTIAASGKRSAMPHGMASEKVIENGDFLTLDFGCVFEGYCSDMTRTVVVGKADERQKEIYDIVLTAQKSAIEAIEAGKKCSEVDAVARGIIKERGYGDNFGHGLGHSVGIEIHEMPSLSPKCHDIIENGHILTVEPGIYIEDFGGVRIEDLIIVEDGKARNLTFSPKELIEL